MNLRNGGLIIAAIILVIASLLIGSRREGAEFAGADGQAMAAVTAINPDYQPWFSPIWQPPSREIEGLLFALQAALVPGLYGAVKRLGLRIPSALGGRFQPSRDGACLEPPLTTIELTPHEMGAQAARLILQRIRGGVDRFNPCCLCRN